MLVFGLLAAGRARAAVGDDQRAEELATQQLRVRRQLQALKAEAGRIVSVSRRDEALGLLGRPSFETLTRRKRQEWEILARLKREGLLEPSATTFFPSAPPMAFIAAPGGVWRGHHSYPGGLVDHTLFNLRAGLALSRDYADTYGLTLDEDLLRCAAIMHDAAKTATLHWNSDGSLPGSETQVAGTGLHHVLAVSEAILRGWPPRWVVTVASAHAPPHPGQDLEELIRILRAAAIVAGAGDEAAGIAPGGRALAAPAPIEAFVTHLDDHDYVLTEATIQAVDRTLARAVAGARPDNWARDQVLARDGDLPLYEKLLKRR